MDVRVLAQRYCAPLPSFQNPCSFFRLAGVFCRPECVLRPLVPAASGRAAIESPNFRAAISSWPTPRSSAS